MTGGRGSGSGCISMSAGSTSTSGAGLAGVAVGILLTRSYGASFYPIARAGHRCLVASLQI
jgi:hypothetical protein